MAARTGFGPVIFGMKARCPRPLDERAVGDPAGIRTQNQ